MIVSRRLRPDRRSGLKLLSSRQAAKFELVVGSSIFERKISTYTPYTLRECLRLPCPCLLDAKAKSSSTRRRKAKRRVRGDTRFRSMVGQASFFRARSIPPRRVKIFNIQLVLDWVCSFALLVSQDYQMTKSRVDRPQQGGNRQQAAAKLPSVNS